MSRLILSLELHLECNTCRVNNLLDENPRKFEIAFAGVSYDSFLICPRCNNEVDEETIADNNYRQRCRTYLARQRRLALIAQGKAIKNGK
mgnify:CR=1 FL=1